MLVLRVHWLWILYKICCYLCYCCVRVFLCICCLCCWFVRWLSVLHITGEIQKIVPSCPSALGTMYGICCIGYDGHGGECLTLWCVFKVAVSRDFLEFLSMKLTQLFWALVINGLKLIFLQNHLYLFIRSPGGSIHENNVFNKSRDTATLICSVSYFGLCQ